MCYLPHFCTESPNSRGITIQRPYHYTNDILFRVWIPWLFSLRNEGHWSLFKVLLMCSRGAKKFHGHPMGHPRGTKNTLGHPRKAIIMYVYERKMG